MLLRLGQPEATDVLLIGGDNGDNEADWKISAFERIELDEDMFKRSSQTKDFRMAGREWFQTNLSIGVSATAPPWRKKSIRRNCY